jgi:methionyl-tRNA formyltransferase
MKVTFMGTPEFSVPVLEALAAAHDVVCVYTQPPRPAGRGKALRLSAVHARAATLDLPVRHPVSLRSIDAQVEFAALQHEVAVVVAYGLILPQPVLDAPRLGCLNIHASLLPRWRGAAPIHRAVMAGDAETGVCIMQMDAGLDTGPVLLRQVTQIGVDETTQDVHDRLSVMGAGLVLQALAGLGTLVPEPQPDVGVTYAHKIDKAEARVDWSQTAVQVDRLIRGLSPFPGAWCDMNGERVKLLRSVVTDGTGTPGQVLGGLTIACGDGAVAVTLAQREGKRAMAPDDFLRGFVMPAHLV